jgi:Trk K+ transport system NAD-binding subunit
MQKFNYKLKTFIKAIEVIAVIHTEHEAAKRITSRQDYKKAAYVLNVELEYFVEILEQEK